MRNFIYANIEGEKDFTLDIHLKVFDAINKQNGEAAAGFMKEHLERTSEIYRRYLHNSL